MTGKEYVKLYHPRASCFLTSIYWPGQIPRRCYLVIPSDSSSRPIGHGETASLAWAEAAANLRAKHSPLGTVDNPFRPFPVGAEKNAWASGMPVITVSKGAAPAASPPAWRKNP